MWLSLVVCCVFSIGNVPRRNRPPTGAASQFPFSQYYCYWVPATKASWCSIHQSPVLHLPQVLRQSSLSRLLQVHHSPIFSAVPCSSAPFTNLHCCAFFKCTIHQSSMLRLVYHSPIFTVAPSPSATLTNLHCWAFFKCTIHQSSVLCLCGIRVMKPLIGGKGKTDSNDQKLYLLIKHDLLYYIK